MTLDNILKEVEPILGGSETFHFAHPSFREVLATRQFAEEIISGLERGDASILRHDVLSKKVIDMVVELGPNKEALYNLVYSTRQKSKEEAGYVGGNSLTLLVALGEDLRGKDFSGTKIRGADLSDCNLEGMILCQADVRGVSFDYSNVHNLNVRGAQMDTAQLNPLREIELCGYDGKNGILYMTTDLGSFMQWEINSGETKRIKKVIDPRTFKFFAQPYNFCLSSQRDRLLVCKRGTGRGPLIEVVDLNKDRKTFLDNLSTLGTVSAFTVSPDGCYVAVAQQPIENTACLTLLDMYSGKIHLQEFFSKDININNVSISRNNRYVVCDLIDNGKQKLVVKDGGRTIGREGEGKSSIFEISDGKLFPVLEGEGLTEPYRKSWFSPDGNFCLTNNGAIFSMEKRNMISKIGNYQGGFQFFSPDGRYVIHLLKILGGDGCWPFASEVKTGSECALIFEESRSISDIILSNNDSTVAVKYRSNPGESYKIAFCNLDSNAKRLIPFHCLDIKSFSDVILY